MGRAGWSRLGGPPGSRAMWAGFLGMSEVSQESQFPGKLLLSFKMLFVSSDKSFKTRGLAWD